MSSQGSGQTLRLRGKSRVAFIGTGTARQPRVGYVSPDVPVIYNSNGAPGVTTFFWEAPAKCRVVAIRELHSTVGAGASKVYVRKHVAGQTAAPAAAVSSTNIVDLVSGGIAADSTANVPQAATVVTTTSGTPAVAYAQMNAGDKLALVAPGTWVGLVTVYINWTV